MQHSLLNCSLCPDQSVHISLRHRPSLEAVRHYTITRIEYSCFPVHLEVSQMLPSSISFFSLFLLPDFLCSISLFKIDMSLTQKIVPIFLRLFLCLYSPRCLSLSLFYLRSPVVQSFPMQRAFLRPFLVILLSPGKIKLCRQHILSGSNNFRLC